MEETIVLITDSSGKVLRAFITPTLALSKRSEDEIIEIAKKRNQLVEFHPTAWMGLDVLKQSIKEMPGE